MSPMASQRPAVSGMTTVGTQMYMILEQTQTPSRHSETMITRCMSFRTALHKKQSKSSIISTSAQKEDGEGLCANQFVALGDISATRLEKAKAEEGTQLLLSPIM